MVSLCSYESRTPWPCIELLNIVPQNHVGIHSTYTYSFEFISIILNDKSSIKLERHPNELKNEKINRNGNVCPPKLHVFRSMTPTITKYEFQLSVDRPNAILVVAGQARTAAWYNKWIAYRVLVCCYVWSLWCSNPLNHSDHTWHRGIQHNIFVLLLQTKNTYSRKHPTNAIMLIIQ